MTDQLTITNPTDASVLALGADVATTHESSFAAATAVSATGEPGQFTADLHPDWSVAGRPNGGYLVAVLGQAVTAAVQTAPPTHTGTTPTVAASGAATASSATHARLGVLAASSHFLRPPTPGSVEVTVETLHTGRTISHLRARLSQGGRPCVESMFTVGELRSGIAATWTGVGPYPSAAPWADCFPLHPDPDVFPVPLLDQVDLRLTPTTMGWAQGRPSGRGELTGWLALPGGAAFDPISLLFAVDAFPPATFDVQMSGWVPTFQLSTYVRALPAPGPVQILHRAQAISDGRVDETCLIWDAAGTLVAQSTQLAGIRLG